MIEERTFAQFFIAFSVGSVTDLTQEASGPVSFFLLTCFGQRVGVEVSSAEPRLCREYKQFKFSTFEL
jgi:hypothetical protein